MDDSRIQAKIDKLLAPTRSIAGSILGRKGGASRSPAKLAAVRRNLEIANAKRRKRKLDEPKAPKDEPKPFVSVLTIR